MNEARRKRIKSIIERLESIQGEICDVQDEEQSALENLPWQLQDGERAENMQTSIDYLESANDVLESLKDELQAAQG